MICFGRSKHEDGKQICLQNLVCYNSTHMMGKVRSLWYQSWHYWTELCKTNHSEQRQSYGGGINLQCTILQVIFTIHLPKDINECLQEMSVQPIPIEQTYDTIPRTSKLTSGSISHRNKLLCLLQARRSHVVICNDIWKEVWISASSSECPVTHWCKSNCFCSSSSIQGRNFTLSFTNSIWCQNWWHKPKGCPNH